MASFSGVHQADHTSNGKLEVFKTVLEFDIAGQAAFGLIGDNMRGMEFVGSLAEGSWTSHLVVKNYCEFELDIMATEAIPLSEQEVLANIMEPVPDNLCLYTIPRSALPKDAKIMMGMQHNSEDHKRWGHGSVVKRDLKNDPEKNGPAMQGIRVIGLAASIVIGILPSLFSLNPRLIWNRLSHIHQLNSVKAFHEWYKNWWFQNLGIFEFSLHGPAVTAFIFNPFMAEGEKESLLSISTDMVMVIELRDWPRDMQHAKRKWIERKRLWPDKKIMEDVLKQGCQLVPKPAKIKDGSLKAKPNTTQWRLTFTKAERELARARNKPQKLVYLMAKSLYYSHLKIETGESQFPSYALKVTMLWLQEETPTDEWTYEDSLFQLSMLFTKLRSFLETGCVPHYFVPEINILGDVSDAVLQATQQKLQEIIDDLPGHLERVLDEDCVKYCTYIHDFYMAGKNVCNRALDKILPSDTADSVKNFCKATGTFIWNESLFPAIKKYVASEMGDTDEKPFTMELETVLEQVKEEQDILPYQAAGKLLLGALEPADDDEPGDNIFTKFQKNFTSVLQEEATQGIKLQRRLRRKLASALEYEDEYPEQRDICFRDVVESDPMAACQMPVHTAGYMLDKILERSDEDDEYLATLKQVCQMIGRKICQDKITPGLQEEALRRAGPEEEYQWTSLSDDEDY